VAENHVEHTCRQLCLFECSGYCECTGGRFLGWLEYNGAASSKRGGYLSRRHHRGEVPGGEGSNRTNGLLENAQFVARLWRRHNPPVGASAFLSVPVECLGRDQEFDPRLGYRFALLDRDV